MTEQLEDGMISRVKTEVLSGDELNALFERRRRGEVRIHSMSTVTGHRASWKCQYSDFGVKILEQAELMETKAPEGDTGW